MLGSSIFLFCCSNLCYELVFKNQNQKVESSRRYAFSKTLVLYRSVPLNMIHVAFKDRLDPQGARHGN